MNARQPGSRLAELLIARRRLVLASFAALTLALAALVPQLRGDTRLEKTLPLKHPYTQTLLAYRPVFAGANRVLVALERKSGDIFDAAFLTALREASDEVLFIPGIDRGSVASIFTPNSRFVDFVEAGFIGGNIVPATFQGTPDELRRIRENVIKAGEVGQLVGSDLRSAMIRADFLEVDPASGEAVDVFDAAARLEALRTRFSSPDVEVHIVGLPTALAQIATAARSIVPLFAGAFALVLFVVPLALRSLRLGAIALAAALLPALWLLGLMPVLGFGIDPLSLLLPDLVFALGLALAVPTVAAWREATRTVAAGAEAVAPTLRRRLLPVAFSLAACALSALALLAVEIDIVRDFALAAALGAALILLAQALLLPALLASTALPKQRPPPQWLATPQRGRVLLALAVLLGAACAWQASRIEIGDPGPGIAELPPQAPFNRDHAALMRDFAFGVEVLTIVAQTHAGGGTACLDYEVMTSVDRFSGALRRVEGVRAVLGLTDVAKYVNAALNEGSLKWRALPRPAPALAQAVNPVPASSGLINGDCSALQLLVFLDDHSGPTLERVLRAAKDAAAEAHDPGVEFMFAGGNVGVLAATRETLQAVALPLLASLVAALFVLSLVAFAKFEAALCVTLPATLAVLGGAALMTVAGVALQVPTLAALTLALGLGALPGSGLYAALATERAAGVPLANAMERALARHAPALVFGSFTLALLVAAWCAAALRPHAEVGFVLACSLTLATALALVLVPAVAGDQSARPAA